MTMVLIAFLSGILTIFSPCILPVVPFVLARPQGTPRSLGLMLFGMVITFATMTTLATIGGAWMTQVGVAGRIAGQIGLATFGAALVFPSVATALMRPFVHGGEHVLRIAQQRTASLAPFLVGVATGLLWAPCAGPVLGLILSGAMLNGASGDTLALLLAYGAGAALSLALLGIAGQKLIARLKRAMPMTDRLRQVAGAMCLASVFVIAMGYDRVVLTKLSVASTNEVEQSLIDGIGTIGTAEAATPERLRQAFLRLGDYGPMPPLIGATDWLNSVPIQNKDLHGKIVVVSFWTYSCINCLRSLPYVRAWTERYGAEGLVVIGVHTPEFAFERSKANVADAVRQLGITWPVAMDNDYAIWRAFSNQYWPAQYIIDGDGRIRHEQFGEGHFERSEQVIRQLLAERGAPVKEGAIAPPPAASGSQFASDGRGVGSAESYIGYAQASAFASNESAKRDIDAIYTAPTRLALNAWALAGTWRIGSEFASARTAHGRLTMRFRARDLHLVMGPSERSGNVRFKVLLDGAEPGRDAGADITPEGNGLLNGHRLYQLIRQTESSRERTFEIEFLDPDADVYAFTFG